MALMTLMTLLTLTTLMTFRRFCGQETLVIHKIDFPLQGLPLYRSRHLEKSVAGLGAGQMVSVCRELLQHLRKKSKLFLESRLCVVVYFHLCWVRTELV